MYKDLFTPVRIRNVTLKNRYAMAPMGPLGLADAQGGFNQRGIDYYTERARGGTALMQDVPEIYAIGDCREFRNVHSAVWDAYEVANHI